MFVGMNIPFHAIEHQSFQAFARCLNENAPVIGRRTVQRSIEKRAADYRCKLQEDIPRNQAVSISTDAWTTAFKNHCLCGVYVNYVDGDWNLKSRLVDVVDTSTAKSSMAHTRKIAEILVDNDLYHRFKFVTADNGPDFKPADLERNVRQVCSERGYINDLIHVPQYQHIPCIAHVIQLVVKDIVNAILSNHPVDRRSNSIRENLSRISNQLSDDDEDWFDPTTLHKRLIDAHGPTAIMTALTKVLVSF